MRHDYVSHLTIAMTVERCGPLRVAWLQRLPHDMTLAGTAGGEGSAAGTTHDSHSHQHGMSVVQQRAVVDAFKVCAHACVRECVLARCQLLCAHARVFKVYAHVRACVRACVHAREIHNGMHVVQKGFIDLNT